MVSCCGVSNSVSQSSHVCLVPFPDSTNRHNPNQTEGDGSQLLKSNSTYVQGQWIGALEILENLHSTNFNQLLTIASKTEWQRLFRTHLSDRGGGGGGSSGWIQRRRRRVNEEENITTGCSRSSSRSSSTPPPPLSKLIPPEGGWLYSESRRRLGPGTNDPVLPKTAKQRKHITDAKNKRKLDKKRRRKRERKRKLAERTRENFNTMERSKSMTNSGFLPTL